MVINALQAVLMVVLVIGLGYFVGYKGWAGKSVTAFLSRLIINITLPCTAVMAFVDYFTAETVRESWIYILVSFGAIAVVYAVSKAVIRVAGIEKERRGVFTALFSYSNSVYIGLPVAAAIFGQGAVAFALLYYIANTTFMNSIGYLEIARDGMRCTGKDGKCNAKQVLRQLVQPPLLAVVVGFVLVMLQIPLPDFLSSAVALVGQATSPLALMFVGIVLQRTGISCIGKIDKKMAWVLGGRFVVSPLVMYAIAAACGLAMFPTEVLTVQMSLPAMVAATIFAENAGADTAFAAKGVAVTTLISFAAIPIYVAMFGG